MKKYRRFLPAALALTLLCSGAALAATGDKNDPLVTLSYLEQTALPGVVSQVETKAAQRQTELAKTLSDQIAAYQQQSGTAGGNSGSAAGYTLITLTSGQTLSLDVGCEVLLRVGTATVRTNDSSAALVDVSAGGTVNNGTALTKNHLYMSTIAGRTLTPTSGTVKVCGRDIGKVRTSDLAKTVGYVFQNPNYQIFCASVRDEIKYGLKNLKLPENEIKTRTKEILAQFGLTSVAKTQPVSLSGGTKKVVALASVCAMDPSILLLDEPTTGQDQPGKQRLGQLMLSLSASGKTIIVISHDMNFVARYAQRVIVMAEGRVIGDDTPARIFSNESVMKQAHVQPPQVYAVVNELRREGCVPSGADCCYHGSCS